jgi:hypothetical protein
MVHRESRRAAGWVTGMVLLSLPLSGCADRSGPVNLSPQAPAHVPATSSATKATATSAPSQRQPHILVFTATGNASVDSVTYVVDGHTVTDQPVTLPWRVSIPVPADGAMHNYEVTVQTHSGTMQILAILDGTVMSSTNGGGGVSTAQLSGSVAG